MARSIRPIMVAVGGDSGTGKATFCAGLREIFGEDRCSEVRLDGYLALNRAQRNAVGLTPLDPRTHDFAAMDHDLWQLSHGHPIVKPVYDHHLGAIAGSEEIEPRELVLVHGMFPLYTPVLRSFFDVTVWMEPEPELKAAWMIQRDMRERGYREEQARAEIARRRADYDRYIAPQAQYADLRAAFSPDKVTFHKGPRLAPLDFRELESESTHFRLLGGWSAGAYPRTIIEVDTAIDPATARRVQSKLWSQIGPRDAARPSVGLYHAADGEHRSPALAIAQLLVAKRITLVAEDLAGAIAV